MTDIDIEFERLNIKIDNVNTKIDVLVNEIRPSGYKGCDVCKRGFLYFMEFIYENNKIIKIRKQCNVCGLVFEHPV